MSKKSFADVVKTRVEAINSHGNFDRSFGYNEVSVPNPSSSVFKCISFPDNYHHNYFYDLDYCCIYDT
jgi:hypothetical protein